MARNTDGTNPDATDDGADGDATAQCPDCGNEWNDSDGPRKCPECGAMGRPRRTERADFGGGKSTGVDEL
jgi:ssDNA-binding Zn-finger/Zn-ribbon topoisomerase 1